jgi:hypothetical protein
MKNPSGLLDVFVLLSTFTFNPYSSSSDVPEPPSEEGRQHQRRRNREKEPHVIACAEAHHAAE